MRLIKYVHNIVAQDNWSVSLTTGSGIYGAILNVHCYRIGNHELTYKQSMHGYGDGRLFPTSEAAWRFAYDHGYTQLYFTSPDLRAKRVIRAYRPSKRA